MLVSPSPLLQIQERGAAEFIQSLAQVDASLDVQVTEESSIVSHVQSRNGRGRSLCGETEKGPKGSTGAERFGTGLPCF